MDHEGNLHTWSLVNGKYLLTLWNSL